jgi:hemerythrin-like metal-binding protein
MSMQTEADDDEIFIEWDPERYSTAIERFDDQHKRLFKLLNDLYIAMEEGRSEERVGEILRELEDYTEYHFGDEEEFMQDCGFAMDCADCFFNHREMHEEFAQKVTELREKHENGEYISMEVLLFARDWLDSHIAGLNQDQNYAEYYEDELAAEYEYEPGTLKSDREDSDPHPDDDVVVPSTDDEITIASEVYEGPALSVPEEPMAEWLETVVDDHGDRTAVVDRRGDETERLAFKEIYREVVSVAGGLLDLGLEPGDRVGIYAQARPEWTVVEMACHLAGLVSVPIAALFDDQRTAHVVADADLAALVSDREPPAAADNVDHELSITDLPTGKASDLPGFDADPDDVATIMYRIGTTEHPNGCAITHRNLRASVEMLGESLPLEPGATGTCFLPLAHAYQRVLNYYLWNAGGAIAYMSRESLLDELAAVQPSVLVGVPGVYEQLHEEIHDRQEEYGGLRGALSQGVAGQVGAAKNEGTSVSAGLSLKHAVANRTVYADLREQLGLGNIEYALTGTDAIDTDLLEFFRGFDVPVSELYEATELTGLATLNRAGEYDARTVGGPLPGVEVALDEDGEVLVRGPNVIDGYWNEPTTWRKKLVDGWYRTGDLGAIEDDALVIEGPK